MWITRPGLSRNVVSTKDKSIVWMNWNGGSSISDAVLNSQFLTRLLTSGKEEFKHVYKQGWHFKYSLWTDSVDFVQSVTFSMTCMTVASLITIYEIQETESEVKGQLLLILSE